MKFPDGTGLLQQEMRTLLLGSYKIIKPASRCFPNKMQISRFFTSFDAFFSAV